MQREWFGDRAAKLTIEDPAGTVRNRLVYRNLELSLAIVKADRLWSFEGDVALLRLVYGAYRNRLAHLFVPYPGIRSSRIDSLPHQIISVYGDLEEASALPPSVPPLHRDSRVAR